MHPTIKQLTLSDLILKRRGTLVYRAVLALFGTALRLFFRRIETVNADLVPSGTGVLFVLNHPNGLVDPGLVFVALPRKISFLAKSTLFRMPIISFLLRSVDALPLYRKIDAGEDVSKNQKTFEMSHDLLRRGGSIAMFPEGVSHNSPKLLPAKTGAARIALGAVSVSDESDPLRLFIVPVGLFYTSKTTFRSEAMLHFGEPFAVNPVKLDEHGQPGREDVRELTVKIERALREVTLNAETESDLHSARIAEEIFSASVRNDNLDDKLDFQQRFVDATTDDINVTQDTILRNRVKEYDEKLSGVGLEPEHTLLARFSRRSVIKQGLLRIWPLVILSPLAVFGSVLHFPAYKFSGIIANRISRHGADDIESTAKVLAGMVLIPLTWLIAAAAIFYFFGLSYALISIPASFLLGYVALYTWEQVEDLRGWANAIWIFLTKREKFLRLYIEGRELRDDLKEFD